MAVDDIKFTVYKEVKDKTTGKSTWTSPVATIGPLNIEDISVTTTSEKLVTKEGSEPKIIPFGVKGSDGRVASIVGTIKNKSLEYQANADSYFDVLQDVTTDQLGYAIGVSVGAHFLPELGTKAQRWKIKQFSWDRQARQMGQWKFNMTVSYVWDPALNEIQLYDKNSGFNIPDNVKFKALSGLPNGGYDAGQSITKPKINTSIHKLNTATFTTPTQIFNKGDIIHIYCETDKSNAVFFGIINEAPKGANMQFSYTCIEIGALLDRVLCAKVGSGLFKPRLKIPNPYRKGKYLTLEKMVALIIYQYKQSMVSNYDPKWGNDKTKKWGKKDCIPYDPSVSNEVKLGPQVLSSMSIYKALMRLLEDQCGMYIWFDNNTGALEYGFIRSQLTIDPLKDIILMSEPTWSNTEDFIPNNVLLYDSDGANWVCYPSPAINGTYIAYQYNSTMNNIMANAMVKKIHKDLQTDRSTYKVKFPAGTVKFRDGDVFTGLGDSTISPVMPYRKDTDYDPLVDSSDTVWQIKDMTITDEYTEIIVGPSYFSVFDLFRSKLTPITEAPVPNEMVSKFTNEVPVSTQATASTNV